MKLLDTSIAVWLLRGDGNVIRRATESGGFCISWITKGELLVGAISRTQHGRLLASVRKFSEAVKVIWPDDETCDTYAQLQVDLRRAGTPIPSNDIWIAAVAVQHGMTLVTADEHFQRIATLTTENWTD